MSTTTKPNSLFSQIYLSNSISVKIWQLMKIQKKMSKIIMRSKIPWVMASKQSFYSMRSIHLKRLKLPSLRIEWKEFSFELHFWEKYQKVLIPIWILIDYLTTTLITKSVWIAASSPYKVLLWTQLIEGNPTRGLQLNSRRWNPCQFHWIVLLLCEAQSIHSN
jgi:hypothetical protein